MRLSPAVLGCVLTLVTAEGVRAQNLYHVFSGDNVLGGYGSAVGGAGDVDNDGLDDLIVGDPYDPTGGLGAGIVRVHRGLDGAILFTFVGPSAGATLGTSVSRAGDVNNDGFVDLIAGAPFLTSGSAKVGGAFVYSGKDGSLLFPLTGSVEFARFGASVSDAGDVNADGVADVIVGAPEDCTAGASAGRAEVYIGPGGALHHTFSGELAGDHFGFAVSRAGDVDGDGRDDLIVGAPRPVSGDGMTFAGRACVFSGATGALHHVFMGMKQLDGFGHAVANLGDLDEDGFDDIAVGAPGRDAGGWSRGMVQAFSGLTGDPLFTITGPTDWAQLGGSLAGAGDVDGDGVPDVVVGARAARNKEAGNGQGLGMGRVQVLSGVNGDPLFSIAGAFFVDEFGRSVDGAGDVDGDGLADVIAGAVNDLFNVQVPGSARVYLGGSALHAGDSFTGTIAPGDEDSVWFQAVGGTRLTWELAAVTGSLLATVVLFDGNGRRLKTWEVDPVQVPVEKSISLRKHRSYRLQIEARDGTSGTYTLLTSADLPRQAESRTKVLLVGKKNKKRTRHLRLSAVPGTTLDVIAETGIVDTGVPVPVLKAPSGDVMNLYPFLTISPSKLELNDVPLDELGAYDLSLSFAENVGLNFSSTLTVKIALAPPDSGQTIVLP
ncbi:MAG: VCBS repeat-containing protein [Planctomycetes bacterium]|nr:VCBS repeat-containing protein [Planctomycetota bacterium]